LSKREREPGRNAHKALIEREIIPYLHIYILFIYLISPPIQPYNNKYQQKKHKEKENCVWNNK
jgi:hypothetical protein